MSVRKGYLYALMLALGLFLWTNVADAWSEPAVPEAKQADTTVVQPWTSAEALYESSMKAQELRLKLVAMHTASDTQQGSLELLGAQEDLQTFLYLAGKRGTVSAHSFSAYGDGGHGCASAQCAFSVMIFCLFKCV